MRRMRGNKRPETLLLLASVEDYAGEILRCALSKRLSMASICAMPGLVRAGAKETDLPCYHPDDLLKRYLCSYPNRVRSSRRLEADYGTLIWTSAWLSGPMV